MIHHGINLLMFRNGSAIFRVGKHESTVCRCFSKWQTQFKIKIWLFFLVLFICNDYFFLDCLRINVN